MRAAAEVYTFGYTPPVRLGGRVETVAPSDGLCAFRVQ